MTEEIPALVSDVPTPSLVVDLDKVKRNAMRMQERCEHLGVKLRAHTKTHKTVEAAEILSNGRRCIAVSTLKEAEFYAENGFDDILYAYPISINKIARCRQLHSQLNEFHVMLDSRAGYDVLQAAPLDGGKRWSVYLEINVKNNRTGVSWKSDDVINLAKLLSSSEVTTFRGLYCHNGDAYSAQGIEALKHAGKESTEALLAVKRRILDHGIGCEVICLGSTPTCSHPDESMSALQEFTPGNYVFYDIMQKDIGSCTMEDIAVRVATRIIGHKPDLNLLIIDCGFLAMSKDGMENDLPDGPWVIQDHPELRLVGMCQEIGKVTSVEGKLDFSKNPIGSLMFIYPYHACATANMHPNYFVHSGENITAVWKPTRGW